MTKVVLDWGGKQYTVTHDPAKAPVEALLGVASKRGYRAKAVGQK